MTEFYRKSVLEEVREMDLAANKHLPGLSVKAVQCQSRSMVAASNCAIRQLYEDGAEYWYRVNDDSKFVTGDWIRDFNAALAAFDPPNLGVVGPTCKQGNTAILTYDYVHRTHFEIFNYHYPPILKNWWCDNWVTEVYGRKRTKKLASQEVSHLVVDTGTRYEVYAKDASGASVPHQLLPAEYKKDSCLIDGWLSEHAEFEAAPRTVNPSGRCASSGPSRECSKAPDGKRVGSTEGWSHKRIGDKNPQSSDWSSCPIPGFPEDAAFGGCVNGRTEPDPASSCGSLCMATEGCRFFWVYESELKFSQASDTLQRGRCCLKSTFDREAGFRQTRGKGGFYLLVPR